MLHSLIGKICGADDIGGIGFMALLGGDWVFDGLGGGMALGWNLVVAVVGGMKSSQLQAFSYQVTKKLKQAATLE